MSKPLFFRLGAGRGKGISTLVWFTAQFINLSVPPSALMCTILWRAPLMCTILWRARYVAKLRMVGKVGASSGLVTKGKVGACHRQRGASFFDGSQCRRSAKRVSVCTRAPVMDDCSLVPVRSDLRSLDTRAPAASRTRRRVQLAFPRGGAPWLSHRLPGALVELTLGFVRADYPLPE